MEGFDQEASIRLKQISDFTDSNIHDIQKAKKECKKEFDAVVNELSSVEKITYELKTKIRPFEDLLRSIDPALSDKFDKITSIKEKSKLLTEMGGLIRDESLDLGIQGKSATTDHIVSGLAGAASRLSSEYGGEALNKVQSRLSGIFSKKKSKPDEQPVALTEQSPDELEQTTQKRVPGVVKEQDIEQSSMNLETADDLNARLSGILEGEKNDEPNTDTQPNVSSSGEPDEELELPEQGKDDLEQTAQKWVPGVLEEQEADNPEQDVEQPSMNLETADDLNAKLSGILEDEKIEEPAADSQLVASSSMDISMELEDVSPTLTQSFSHEQNGAAPEDSNINNADFYMNIEALDITDNPDAEIEVQNLCKAAVESAESGAEFTIPEGCSEEMKTLVKESLEAAIQEGMDADPPQFNKGEEPVVCGTERKSNRL